MTSPANPDRYVTDLEAKYIIKIKIVTVLKIKMSSKPQKCRQIKQKVRAEFDKINHEKLTSGILFL